MAAFLFRHRTADNAAAAAEDAAVTDRRYSEIIFRQRLIPNSEIGVATRVNAWGTSDFGLISNVEGSAFNSLRSEFARSYNSPSFQVGASKTAFRCSRRSPILFGRSNLHLGPLEHGTLSSNLTLQLRRRNRKKVNPGTADSVDLRRDLRRLARIFHSRIEQRSGGGVRRLENIEPNETGTHRFFFDRL